MTKDEFVKEVKEIEQLQKEYDFYNEKLSSLFGIDSTAENSFLPLFFKMRDNAVKHLSQIVGDKDEWLNWYFSEVLETHSVLSATIHGEEIECVNAFDIWGIIQKSA